MEQIHKSFEQYASRRLELEGGELRQRYPYCQPVDALGVGSTDRSGCVSFAHYDYLGISSDPRVLVAAREALEVFGTGAGASRLVGGELSIHRALEREIAEFLRVEDALTLVSGYATNVAVLAHVMAKADLIVVDQAAHNSIIVGMELSRARSLVFRHNDLDHLAEILKSHRAGFSRVLVVVEGLYSMDGDVPDLPKLIEICRRHGAWLMVDEAHSIGVLGKTGRGITEHFGIAADEVDLIVGTLSKALVTSGGFVAGRRAAIEWLRYTMPGFVYSVGLSPPVVAAARTALRILDLEPQRVSRLRDNGRYFLEAAKQRNLATGAAIGVAVIPILRKSVESAIASANKTLAAGFYVPPIIQIAVPKDLPRLRFFVTERHTPQQIDAVLDVLAHDGRASEPVVRSRPRWDDATARGRESRVGNVEA